MSFVNCGWLKTLTPFYLFDICYLYSLLRFYIYFQSVIEKSERKTNIDDDLFLRVFFHFVVYLVCVLFPCPTFKIFSLSIKSYLKERKKQKLIS